MKGLSSLTWCRPTRERGIAGTWRRYVTKCRNYRVSVRIDGPDVGRVFYATRLMHNGHSYYWGMISRHRTLAAAQKACVKSANSVL